MLIYKLGSVELKPIMIGVKTYLILFVRYHYAPNIYFLDNQENQLDLI